VGRLVAAGAGRGELVEEPTMAKRCALYARVSTTEQTAENQLLALRAFTGARGWEPAEFIDQGQSGAKERRPALDAMMAAVRTRKVDVVVATKLDRLARSVHHLVAMGQELQALGVDLVVLDQAIDSTTPSGRLLFHVLASIAEPAMFPRHDAPPSVRSQPPCRHR
jgi:DNA invertase Pin-like site-specific DNA recombinase